MSIKNRIRLDQLRGGVLDLADNDAAAAKFEVSGESYLLVDSTTGSEVIELGEVTNVGVKLEGAISGDAIESDLSSSALSTKLPSASAVKSYVDNFVQGLDVKESVRVATTEDLDDDGAGKEYTYLNNGGTGNVGTITKDATGYVKIDGYTLELNDRVLVKDQVRQRGNGIYKVTTKGTDGKSSMTVQINKNDNFSQNIDDGDTFAFQVDSNGDD